MTRAHTNLPSCGPDTSEMVRGFLGVEEPNIGWAVKRLRNGESVRRAGWNGKGMYLTLQSPDAHSKMTEPYVYMRTAQGGLIPWLCSQADLLATDWEEEDILCTDLEQA